MYKTASPAQMHATTTIHPSTLAIEGVSHRYGARQALIDVTFSVAPSTFTVLLGLNGAGKSTLFSATRAPDVPGKSRPGSKDSIATIHRKRGEHALDQRLGAHAGQSLGRLGDLPLLKTRGAGRARNYDHPTASRPFLQAARESLRKLRRGGSFK